MTPEIEVHQTSGVLTITLSRPDKKNALTNDMYGALGEPLPAETAVAWGLANATVPVAQLQAQVHKMAETIATKPRDSLTAMKQLMRETEKLVAQMDSENATFAERLRSAEAREAFLAFAQKRPPNFAKLAGQ